MKRKPPTGKPNRPLQYWRQAASVEQRKQLAKHALTTVGHLKQIANGHRGISAEMALNLEYASHKVLGWKLLPPLMREKLSPSSCGRCEFALICRGKERIAGARYPLRKAA